MKTTYLYGMLLLGSCRAGFPAGYTNNWEGADQPGHTYADFGRLNGRQRFEMNLPGSDSGFVHYTVQRKSGMLKMMIRSADKTIVDAQVDQVLSDSLVLPANRRYSVTFIGNKASGRFDVKYGIK